MNVNRIPMVFMAFVLLAASTAGLAGSISGTTTRASDGEPLAVLMLLYDLARGGAELDAVVTDPDGRYRFDNLDPSDGYVVQVFNPAGQNLIGEVWQDIRCSIGCDISVGTPISVGASENVGGIDFSLETGATITGRLTRADNGTGVGNTVVAAYRRNSEGVLSGAPAAFTDADGFYAIGGLETATYIVALPQLHDAGVTNADGLQGEAYDNLRCPCDFGDGTPLDVVEGETLGSIDFVLESAPFEVSGRVTDDVGRPIEGIEVQIVDRNPALDDIVGTTLAGKEVTDADGRFMFNVDEGGYLVFTAAREQGFADEFFDDIPVSAGPDAAPILTITGSRSDINFELSSGASIEGRVTRADGGAPVAGLLVTADNLADNREFTDETDGNGRYSIRGVAPGSYRVSTFSGPGFNLVNEIYDNIPCQQCDETELTPVEVGPGAAVTGIDFALDTGGGIVGSVTGDNGEPLTRVLVVAFDATGRAVGQEFVSGSGNYRIQGLIPGPYTVQTQRAGGFSRINETFDDRPCIGNCDPTAGLAVTVAAGSPVQGVDFVLSRVPTLADGTPVALDDLGAAIAVDDDLLVVGVPGDDEAGTDAGAIQIFSRMEDGFALVRKVFATDAAPGDRFGSAVAIDNGLVVVGATGSAAQAKGGNRQKQSAYLLGVFGSNVTELQQLVAANLANAATSGFGSSVAMSGETVIVGAPTGEKLDVDGAGSPSGSASGTVVVFQVDGGNATQVAVLNDPEGESGDNFGAAVATSGGMIVAGMPDKQTNGLTTGAVAIFGQLGDNLFSDPQRLTGAANGDGFGAALAIDGETMVVGAPGIDEVAADAGGAIVFNLDGGNFVQSRLLLPVDPISNEPLGRSDGAFGAAVSLRAGSLAIGAAGEDGEATAAGAAYLFARGPDSAPDEWSLGDRLISVDGSTGDLLGRSVAVGVGTVAVGAPRASASGVNAGVVFGASSNVEDVVFTSGFEPR